MPAALRDVVKVIESRYDPRWAESWDAVGLVCGDPDARVEKVLFAVDPVAEVVDEALEWGADLLITHHPLFLRPVNGVPATNYKGRLVHRLIAGGCGLLVAHTNADCATGGVSDALADALKLPPGKPIEPRPCDPMDKIVTFVPHADADRVLDALAIAGAGAIGDYDRCAFTTEGTGTFRPLPGANPTIGAVGKVETVAETRLEMVLSRDRRGAVLAALRAAHPYEEPAFDVLELAGEVGPRGTGRVCVLDEPEPLSMFVARVRDGLPATAGGIRVAGDSTRLVRRIAVCGGAGDSLLGAVRSIGADVYVTADLRHHPASEAREVDGAPALVDVAHWASEWPWLARAAQELEAGLTGRSRVQTRVSEIVTDPWTLHI
ncbi:Nif3-like dinuclear metal center hexameric protein [Sporichthya polymorpha]|uniref:Nif3-like dinuclear metal center hexameric protein n=1 Tax=Sporichthya polymorpha TaxID=35751 RepID=UPI00039C01E3|nr:Nif3-like dinuclear metal center hexameric protein [Sporichthya polymorpha]